MKARSTQLSRVLRRHIITVLRKCGVIDFIAKCFPAINSFHLCGVPSGRISSHNLGPLTVYKGYTETIPPPKTSHNKVHWKFLRESTYPESFVLNLRNGFSTDIGVNLTGSGKVIPEVYCEMNSIGGGVEKLEEFVICRYGGVRPGVVNDRDVVATLTSSWQSNYFHWLFDVLPRLNLIERAGIKPHKIYVEARKDFQKQTLTLVGYQDEGIVDAGTINCIRAAQLVVPSLPGISGNIPRWVCEYLRKMFLGEDGKGTRKSGDRSKRIYISRAKARDRRIINERELIEGLDKYGVVAVDPENMEFKDQVDCFRNADVIVSGHGAGLSNVVFCKRGTKVLEIFSPSYVNVCYRELSHQVSLDYYYVLGDGKSPPEFQEGHGVRENIMVSVKNVEKALEEMCV